MQRKLYLHEDEFTHQTFEEIFSNLNVNYYSLRKITLPGIVLAVQYETNHADRRQQIPESHAVSCFSHKPRLSVVIDHFIPGEALYERPRPGHSHSEVLRLKIFPSFFLLVTARIIVLVAFTSKTHW